MARGVGVGHRPQMVNEVDKMLQHVDFLEYNQRSYIELVKQDLAPFLGKIPVVVHSLNLSLGSVEPPSQNRIEALQQTVELVRPSWVSEHLSYSRHGDIEIDNFIALPYTDEAIEVVAGHIRMVKDALGVPFAMENITHSFTWPERQYSEAEFIKRVLEAADCGLLLDVTNLFLNAEKHGYDPYDFLRTIPRDRVLQLHLAGHTVQEDGELIDSHVGGIDKRVLEITEWVLQNTTCDALIIERDTELEAFEDVLDDLTACKALFNRYRSRVHSG